MPLPSKVFEVAGPFSAVGRNFTSKNLMLAIAYNKSFASQVQKICDNLSGKTIFKNAINKLFRYTLLHVPQVSRCKQKVFDKPNECYENCERQMPVLSHRALLNAY